MKIIIIPRSLFFTGRMSFQSPNHHCRSIEDNRYTFSGLTCKKMTPPQYTSSICSEAVHHWVLWILHSHLIPQIVPGHTLEVCQASHQPSQACTPVVYYCS